MQLERPGKIAVFNEALHHRGHPAEDAVIHKQRFVGAHFGRVEGRQGPHVLQQILHGVITIAPRPEELLEVHGAHLIVRLVADTVAVDLLVMDAQQ